MVLDVESHVVSSIQKEVLEAIASSMSSQVDEEEGAFAIRIWLEMLETIDFEERFACLLC